MTLLDSVYHTLVNHLNAKGNMTQSAFWTFPIFYELIFFDKQMSNYYFLVQHKYEKLFQNRKIFIKILRPKKKPRDKEAEASLKPTKKDFAQI